MQSAADGFNLELIQANYGNIARNLEAVTRAVGETEEAISQAENQAGGRRHPSSEKHHEHRGRQRNRADV